MIYVENATALLDGRRVAVPVKRAVKDKAALEQFRSALKAELGTQSVMFVYEEREDEV